MHYCTIAKYQMHYQRKLEDSKYSFSIKKNKTALATCKANIEYKSADICDLMDEIKSLKTDHKFTPLQSVIFDVFRDPMNSKPFNHSDFRDRYVCINCATKASVCKCDI